MVKRVVDSRTVLHLFANQSQDNARTPSDNLSFEGKSLWSYRTEIARFLTLRDNSELLLIDNYKYSVTTAKQVRWLYQAARHKSIKATDSLKLVAGFIHGRFGPTLELAQWVTQEFDGIRQLDEKAKRARSEWNRDSYRSQAAHLREFVGFVWFEATGQNPADILGTAKIMVEGFNRDKAIAKYAKALAEMQAVPTLDLNPLLSGVSEFPQREAYYAISSVARQLPRSISVEFAFKDSAGLCEAERLMGKKYLKAYAKAEKAAEPICVQIAERLNQAKAAFDLETARRESEWQAKQDAENAEKLAAWLALESDYPPRVSVVQCRVKGEEVQTTQGARVPLDHALAMVALAKRCRASGKEYTGKDQVGAFRLSKVSATGDLTIGCHFIPWDSIVKAMSRYMGESL